MANQLAENPKNRQQGEDLHTAAERIMANMFDQNPQLRRAIVVVSAEETAERYLKAAREKMNRK